MDHNEFRFRQFRKNKRSKKYIGKHLRLVIISRPERERYLINVFRIDLNRILPTSSSS